MSKIARSLRQHGVSPWLDSWKVIIGTALDSVLTGAIENCDCFVLFWSASAKQSEYVELERRYAALFPDKRKVWVRLDDATPPPELSRHVWLDWFSWWDSRTFNDKLILLVRAILGKPLEEPPPSLRKPTGYQLADMFFHLAEHYGVQNWWARPDKFQLCLEAILKQGATQEKVDAVVENLRIHRALTPQAIYSLPSSELELLIRSCGREKAKASCIKEFVIYLKESCGFDVNKLFKKESFILRAELLGIRGLGRFTCDNILLYGGDRRTLPVNEYNRKVFCEHYLSDPSDSYQRVQERFEDALTAFGARELRELDRMLFRVRKDYCHAEPDCANCPLMPLLPNRGPRSARGRTK